MDARLFGDVITFFWIFILNIPRKMVGIAFLSIALTVIGDAEVRFTKPASYAIVISYP